MSDFSHRAGKKKLRLLLLLSNTAMAEIPQQLLRRRESQSQLHHLLFCFFFSFLKNSLPFPVYTQCMDCTLLLYQHWIIFHYVLFIFFFFVFYVFIRNSVPSMNYQNGCFFFFTKLICDQFRFIYK